MLTKITKKQRAVLYFIVEYVSLNERSPTYRETMEKFGFISPASVYHHLIRLQWKGYIRLTDARSRNIVLCDIAKREYECSH